MNNFLNKVFKPFKKEKLLQKKKYSPANKKTKKAIKTGYTWAEQKKMLVHNEVIKRNEINRKKIVEEVHRLRNTRMENGKFPTYRDLERMTGISKTEIGDILNGKANGKYLAKRLDI